MPGLAPLFPCLHFAGHSGSFLVAMGLVYPFGIQPAQGITEQLPPPHPPLPLSIPVLRLLQGHFT